MFVGLFHVPQATVSTLEDQARCLNTLVSTRQSINSWLVNESGHGSVAPGGTGGSEAGQSQTDLGVTPGGL